MYFWQVLNRMEIIKVYLTMILFSSLFPQLVTGIFLSAMSVFFPPFSQFYQYGLKGINFICGVIIHYYHHFVGETVLTLGRFLCAFNMPPPLFCFCF